jgi:hypothetical protein
MSIYIKQELVFSDNHSRLCPWFREPCKKLACHAYVEFSYDAQDGEDEQPYCRAMNIITVKM